MPERLATVGAFAMLDIRNTVRDAQYLMVSWPETQAARNFMPQSYVVPDERTLLIRDHEDEGDQEAAAIERAVRERSERQRAELQAKREGWARQKRLVEHAGAIRMNDCHDAHGGDHPWQLRIEGGGGASIDCALCNMPYPVPDYTEFLDGRFRVTVGTEGGGMSPCGEPDDFYVTVSPINYERPHRHVWEYMPDGQHMCTSWNTCDAYHSEHCHRPCGRKSDPKGLL